MRARDQATGERIREHRRHLRRGRTLRDLADAIDVSLSTAARLERGEATLHAWQVIPLARYLGMDPRRILRWAEEETR